MTLTALAANVRLLQRPVLTTTMGGRPRSRAAPRAAALEARDQGQSPPPPPESLSLGGGCAVDAVRFRAAPCLDDGRCHEVHCSTGVVRVCFERWAERVAGHAWREEPLGVGLRGIASALGRGRALGLLVSRVPRPRS